jgi:hypothetical protein
MVQALRAMYDQTKNPRYRMLMRRAFFLVFGKQLA